MTSRYDFTSEWLIRAPSGACADAVDALLDGESWWPGVRLHSDAPLAPGAVIQMTVMSPLGYRLRVSARVDRYRRGEYLSTTAVGDLAGAGEVRLHEEQRRTRITIRWTVAPARRWMRLASPVARPLFRLAHAVVMRRGEAGLRRRTVSASTDGS